MSSPLDPIPDWYVASQPDNSNLPVANNKSTIIGVAITFLTFALIAAILRLFVRWRARIWGWDDFFVILSATGCTIGSVLICEMPDDGLGLHWWTLSVEQRMMFFKHIWATNITYSFSTTCVKIAILVQYLRLFETQHRTARKVILGLLAILATWGVTFTLLAIFACRPISSFWRPHETNSKCVGWGSKNPDVFFATFVGHAASNMVLDMFVLGLPIPFFRDLRMSGKTRIGLFTLFGMGGIAVSLAIARVVSLCIKKGGTVPVFDITHSTPTVYIFSVLEINVAIMCASIPIFWPLVTSLTSSKILIVNEIEIRSERRSEHMEHLMDLNKSRDFATIGEVMDTGRHSRASLHAASTTSQTPEPPKMAYTAPSSQHESPSARLARSLSRPRHTSRHHNHQKSSSSSKDIPLALRSRRSEDEDNASLVHKSSTRSFASSNAAQTLRSASSQNPLAGLQNPEDLTHARYKDKYNQEWAVPDFDAGAPPAMKSPGLGGSGSAAQVPFDHIGKR